MATGVNYPQLCWLENLTKHSSKTSSILMKHLELAIFRLGNPRMLLYLGYCLKTKNHQQSIIIIIYI